MSSICSHCEHQAHVTPLGLCPACHARKGIRRMYYPRQGWTEADERMLRELRQRANQGLPLFPRQRG
jgi:hypothetical protein